jgi:hypothetical protein
MIFRFSQEFWRIEWIGNQETNNLIDPMSIQVVLRDEAGSVFLQGDPVRASRGRYFVEFEMNQLIPGDTYSIFWTYFPIGNVEQVKRHDFVWKDQLVNTNDNFCLIYGRITDGVGMPLNGQEIQLLQYDDFIIKSRLISSVIELTDAFGHWRVNTMPGQVYQLIRNNHEVKTFTSPKLRVVNFIDLASYDYPNIIRKDSFGNPIDGMRLESTVQQYFLGPKNAPRSDQ